MKRMVFSSLAALLLAAAWAQASDPVGIYALIDKVVQEPKDGTPERIQVWGVFVLGSNRGNEHTPPMRGYMYFSTTPGKEELCRREWADLKKIAGTGQVVAFGSSYAPTGHVRKPQPRKETAPPADEARLAALLKDLDSEQFAVREQATRELEKQGEPARAFLRKALESKQLGVEARRRVERLVGTERPDTYPLGFGLTKLEGDFARFWRNALLALPEPLAPADAATVETGKIMLRTKNIGSSDHHNAGYVFEIEENGGMKETSSVVTAGSKESEWSPHMEVKAGKKYVWRVWPVEGQWKGPAAESSFQGKVAP
jgi:hypothetical protein